MKYISVNNHNVEKTKDFDINDNVTVLDKNSNKIKLIPGKNIEYKGIDKPFNSNKEGTYEIEMNITDSKGNMKTFTTTLFVNDTNNQSTKDNINEDTNNFFTASGNVDTLADIDNISQYKQTDSKGMDIGGSKSYGKNDKVDTVLKVTTEEPSKNISEAFHKDFENPTGIISSYIFGLIGAILIGKIIIKKLN